MQDIIQLLPDHIANQIAAGEVVQRPASVVKELMENSLDAGATRLELVLKDAGKQLIQVVDNGKGMSAQDARMAFERHATSKIRSADDLFNIRTMGFRGEALASIAAVAQVQMKTRLQGAELGTEIQIEGSTIKSVEACMTAPGSSIAVKNLFFNVPARRNFLKSNPVETRHILNEFIRIALSHPEMTLRLEHNTTVVFDLPPAHMEQRIVDLFGKNLKGKLLPIAEDTPYVSMNGFLGHPECARRKRGDQFFFVNNRFIKSHYLNHAVTTAFANLIPDDNYPFYCIFLELDPKHIDINIHPTKTEIKFDDERTIYSLLHSVIRKGLGDFHKAPVEMEDKGFMEILNRAEVPSGDERTIGGVEVVQTPNHRSNPSQSGGWGDLYPNPSARTSIPRTPEHRSTYTASESSHRPKSPDLLFPGLGDSFKAEDKLFPEEPAPMEDITVSQMGGRYLLYQQNDGLVVIDQCHAHQRILYERFLKASNRAPLPSQQLLFPRTVSFSPVDFSFLREIIDDVKQLGFDLNEFGANTYILHGVPALLKGSKAEQFFEDIVAEVRETELAKDISEKIHEALARSIAQKTAMQPGKKLAIPERKLMVEQLFQCDQPGFSPSGKPTYYRLEMKDLEQFFQGRVK
ncbi:UNVERIFIED_CONTAM: hypothetical protein GTU68_029157 [Idotea baltica]|nr:hypothetical protein [Idotea baltica]